MVTIDDVRALASTLPRTTEALVRDRVKFRVGRIVYLAFSSDETMMGFAFPKEERDALVASEPDKFLLPKPADLRYHWVVVRLAAIDDDRDARARRGGVADRRPQAGSRRAPRLVAMRTCHAVCVIGIDGFRRMPAAAVGQSPPQRAMACCTAGTTWSP